MRSLSLLSVLAAGAVAYLGPTSDDPADYEWSFHPDPTAAEYLEYGSEVPALAAGVNEVVPESSYVVKLECLGCPFRVRPFMSSDEYFTKEPENSLLLNFTIGADGHSLELNNKRVLPLSIPTKIWAYQTPSNLTADIMKLMIDMQMLDESFLVGTKYGAFELSYEHITTLSEPGVEVLRFDVTNIDITTSHNPGTYELAEDAQKAVEIKVSQSSWETGLNIQSVAIVDRAQEVPHGKMACGKDAPINDFRFRSTEWDYYGQAGTWSRSLFVVWDKSLDWFVNSIPMLIIVALLLGAVSIVRKREIKRKAEAAIAEREFYMVDEEEGLLEVVDEEGKKDEELDYISEEL